MTEQKAVFRGHVGFNDNGWLEEAVRIIAAAPPIKSVCEFEATDISFKWPSSPKALPAGVVRMAMERLKWHVSKKRRHSHATRAQWLEDWSHQRCASLFLPILKKNGVN